MADVEVTVRGTARVTHSPTRATVHLRASADGPDRAVVLARAGRSAQAVTDSIAPLADEASGPIRRWISEQLRVHSHREVDGRKQATGRVVHHADVGFRVRFDDFDALQSWLASVVALDGVEVSHVEWSLTRGRREQLAEQVRAQAVRDAQERAAAYARDLGLTAVRPIAISDPGLLGSTTASGGPAEPGYPASAARTLGSRGMSVGFRPRKIEVRAAVDARFMAS